MKNKLYHDNNRRILHNKLEQYRNTLLYLKNNNIEFNSKLFYSLELSKLPRNSSKIRIQNRCIYTGRAHSVFRKFKMSRLIFRQLSLDGNISGITKSTW